MRIWIQLPKIMRIYVAPNLPGYEVELVTVPEGSNKLTMTKNSDVWKSSYPNQIQGIPYRKLERWGTVP